MDLNGDGLIYAEERYGESAGRMAYIVYAKGYTDDIGANGYTFDEYYANTASVPVNGTRTDRVKTKTAWGVSNTSSPAAVTFSNKIATLSYYNDEDNRIESTSLVNPDKSGNIYYHFTNQSFDRNGDGEISDDENFGLADRWYRQTPTKTGIISWTAEYDANRNVTTQIGYSDVDGTQIVVTYEFDKAKGEVVGHFNKFIS